jgi:hypothetical protein
VDLWWKDKAYKQILYHGEYGVGEVKRPFGAIYIAVPWWQEDNKHFESEEEAKSWLATVYRLEHSTN